ncbi:hypothetical protein AX14_007387 [Amanita brunnescens Koide BX004]|nr:hypothetical protein AX14_007387 [Amanita brunnescens Koide BX004]
MTNTEPGSLPTLSIILNFAIQQAVQQAEARFGHRVDQAEARFGHRIDQLRQEIKNEQNNLKQEFNELEKSITSLVSYFNENLLRRDYAAIGLTALLLKKFPTQMLTRLTN